jgi:hypothetical protein
MRGDFTALTSSPTGFRTGYPSRTIALSRDERYLINGSDSSYLQVYDLLGKEKKTQVIQGVTGAVNDIEFLKEGDSFIITTADRKLLIGSLAQLSLRTLLQTAHEIKSMSLHPNGKIVAGATWTGQVILINLSDLSSTTISDERDTRVLSVKFSPDGNTLAYGVDDIVNKRGLVKLYDLSTKETRQFSGHRAAVTDVEFSPDGKLLASAGSDKRLLLWLLESPEELPITMANNTGFNPRLLSPTRFHNSVHNAAAGYWTIATGCRAPYTALTAWQHTFAAGLLEALTQAACGATPVLYVAYDIQARGPLASMASSTGLLGAALVLAPEPSGARHMTLHWTLIEHPDAAHLQSSARNPALVAGNAMAACLPLFEALAHGASGTVRYALGPHCLLELQLAGGAG